MSFLYYLPVPASFTFVSNYETMKKTTIVMTAISLAVFTGVNAQAFEQLNELKGHSVKIWYSSGHAQRAAGMATRLDKAMKYNQQLLGFKPEVSVLILAPADWSKYTKFPVYGMPHYNDDKTLIVAAEDNAFWKSFIPPLEQLPQDMSSAVQKVYSREDGTLSMQAFFDLLAIHELGHAFHMQAGLTMQRKWMGELFVNMLLHTYIAENEPASLPALQLFPRMVVAGGTKGYTYTRLADIEERYEEIGEQHPKNYGWYQCRWHAAAAGIYDAGGKSILVKLWEALKNQKEVLADTALVSFLETTVGSTVADVMRNWDQEVLKSK